MFCLRNISVDTLHKGDTGDNDADDDGDDDDDNDNNLYTFFSVAQYPILGLGRLILEVPRKRARARARAHTQTHTHTDTHPDTPHTV
jgi:hypothetical protein